MEETFAQLMAKSQYSVPKRPPADNPEINPIRPQESTWIMRKKRVPHREHSGKFPARVTKLRKSSS